MNPHATTATIQKIPRKIPHTNPTPPDESDTTGQVFFQIRMNPTPPDHSDGLQPPHNPSVVGSIPTGPTNPYEAPYSPTNSRRFLVASEQILQLNKWPSAIFDRFGQRKIGFY
jgi:hypothetical protein